MTELETRTLARASILLLVAAGARWGWEARRPVPLLPVDSSGVLPRLIVEGEAARAEAALRSKPLGADERIEVNRAGEVELDRLPGVGPATARALVASREEEGPFLRPEDLARVRGIGPASVAKMAEHVDFGALAGGGEGARRAAPVEAPELGALYGAEAAPRAGSGARDPSGATGVGGTAPPPVDLNEATAEELETLPGVGPALAGRIVELRERKGRFARVEDLLEVRGIGPATLERLRGRVVVR